MSLLLVSLPAPRRGLAGLFFSASALAGLLMAPAFAAAPANDNFSAATVLTGAAEHHTATNIDATKQTLEPNHASNGGGHSVWWRWTAPASAAVSVDTLGSTFDTLLGVYTGNAVTSLITIASSDDIGGLSHSALIFQATAGTTYAIAVDGRAGASGAIRLNLDAAILTVSTLAGTSGAIGTADGTGPAARFSSPSGVAVDASGNLYLADFYNHTIRKVTPAGVVTTVAGAAGVLGSTDGAAADARFYAPSGVAVDAANNLYVSDTFNQTVRKISAAGVVSTLAGTAGSDGSTDGTGAAARFYHPYSVAVDTLGNVHVVDGGNHTIRTISPAGVVTTLAGTAGVAGSTDGIGAAARFALPSGVGVDAAGYVYVADWLNHTVRKITPAGVVTTLAGTAGAAGSVDGIGAAARFNNPSSVAVDTLGNLYVADYLSQAIRKITPAGVVTTVAGTAGVVGASDGTGPVARFNNPVSVAVDATGYIYVSEFTGQTIRKAVPLITAPTISTPPGAASAAAGTVAQFTVAAGGGTVLSYRWQVQPAGSGTWTNVATSPTYSGATTATLRVNAATGLNGAQFRVIVTDTFGTGTTTSAGTLSVGVGSRLLNLSTRGLAQSGDNVLIPGFVISGTGTKRLLLRAIGPSLGDLVPSFTVIPDPQMVLRRLNTAVVPAVYVEFGANDNWGTNANAAAITSTAAQLFAFPFTDANDSALLLDLPAGQYTITAGDLNGASGIAMVELYDADAGNPTSALINISNRGFAGVGDEVMIPGFVVSSEGPKTLLVRVVGPTLAGFGVPGTMVDPKLTFYQTNPATGANTELFTQDNWGDATDAAYTATFATQVSAFPLTAGSADAATVVTLEPGVYTVVGSSADGTSTGVVLVEVYIVP